MVVEESRDERHLTLAYHTTCANYMHCSKHSSFLSHFFKLIYIFKVRIFKKMTAQQNLSGPELVFTNFLEFLRSHLAQLIKKKSV